MLLRLRPSRCSEPMELDGSAAKAGVQASLILGRNGFDQRAGIVAEARRGGPQRGPLWIVAHHANRWARPPGCAWVSPPGNLSATLLLTDPAPNAHVAQLSFVVALAVHDAICDAAPMIGPRLKLKWPNDVLCGGAKIAGILLEGEGKRVTVAPASASTAAHHPETDTEYPAMDFAEYRWFPAVSRPCGLVHGFITGHGGADFAVGARRGLCLHSRRLAQAGRRRRTATSASACMTRES